MQSKFLGVLMGNWKSQDCFYWVWQYHAPGLKSHFEEKHKLARRISHIGGSKAMSN